VAIHRRQKNKYSSPPTKPFGGACHLCKWIRWRAISTEADALFRVGFSDFPMLDNVRLPQGYRCSIALREFQDESAEITFVHFPSSRASLKEKLFYDEILYNLRNLPQRLRLHRSDGPEDE
jgi:hypothetical protein